MNTVIRAWVCLLGLSSMLTGMLALGHPQSKPDNLNLEVLLQGSSGQLKTFKDLFLKSKLGKEKFCILEHVQEAPSLLIRCTDKATNPNAFRLIGDVYLDLANTVLENGQVLDTSLAFQFVAAKDCSSVHCQQAHGGGCSSYGNACYHSGWYPNGAHQCHPNHQ